MEMVVTEWREYHRRREVVRRKSGEGSEWRCCVWKLTEVGDGVVAVCEGAGQSGQWRKRAGSVEKMKYVRCLLVVEVRARYLCCAEEERVFEKTKVMVDDGKQNEGLPLWLFWEDEDFFSVVFRESHSFLFFLFRFLLSFLKRESEVLFLVAEEVGFVVWGFYYFSFFL